MTNAIICFCGRPADSKCSVKFCPYFVAEPKKPVLSVVTSLNEGRPALNDIPGRLRLLADQIDAGDIDAENCIVIIPREKNKEDWPRVWGFGNVDGEFNPIITLNLALQWWIKFIMKNADE